ncbi:hypothetical protein GCM10023116_48260 [Kistimonas scapharcae]|uniref:Uncharacterized protein n=1 Tax=Kistimonas scapharcae TaxID=1036133 RepID=A0ABP8V9F6_9GAMM
MNPEDQQAVDRIAAAQLGAEPRQGPEKSDATPEEQAVERAAPKTEDKKGDEAPVIYEVEFGENDKRQLTPQQIKATFERYASQNYKNQQMKPVNQVIDAIMNKYNAKPETLAKALIEMEKGYNKQQNPQQTQQSNPQSDDPDPFKTWEDENSASLPPGYREMNGQMKQLAQQNMQLQQMLQQVLAKSQGVADAAKQGQQQAANQNNMNIRQQIANNLDRAQQQVGIDSKDAQEFMTFAAERGYTLEDFVDPHMTLTVMNDYKANKDGPEMTRLREIMQRRQAYTGTVEGGPGAGGEPAKQDPALADIDRLATAAFNRRNPR